MAYQNGGGWPTSARQTEHRVSRSGSLLIAALTLIACAYSRRAGSGSHGFGFTVAMNFITVALVLIPVEIALRLLSRDSADAPIFGEAALAQTATWPTFSVRTRADVALSMRSNIVKGDRLVLKMAYWEIRSTLMSLAKNLLTGKSVREEWRLISFLFAGAVTRFTR